MYGVYARVVDISEIERVSAATSEISDTKQRVRKHRTKHFPYYNLFI